MKSFNLGDTQDHLSERALAAGARVAPSGTTFIVVRGMILAHTFPVCVAQREMSFNQDVKAIVAKSAADGRFVAHWFNGHSDALLRVVTEATHGTKRIELADLLRYPIELPPLQEQRCIADVIDTLDEAVLKTEQLVAKLQQMKQGLLHDLLTRGIDENGKARELTQPTGAMPQHWRLVRLDDLADVAGGVTLGRALSGPATVDLPYLRVANVQDGHLDLADVKTVRILRSEEARYRLEVGDVLMNEGGDFDKLGRGTVWQGQIERCLHQNHVFRVRCRRDVLRPWFLAAVSESTIGKSYFVRCSKQTTNLATINSTQIKALPVPLPPVEEQDRIIDALAAAKHRIGAENNELAKLRLLKQGLMDDLLTGRVRVTPLLGEPAP